MATNSMKDRLGPLLVENNILTQEKLDEARNILAISGVSRESGPLEYILVKTGLDINYRIYEDGLIILEKEFESLQNDFVFFLFW